MKRFTKIIAKITPVVGAALISFYSEAGVASHKVSQRQLANQCVASQRTSCLLLGNFYDSPIMPGDLLIPSYKVACFQSGSGGACYALGLGLNKTNKSIQAIKYFMEGCSSGHGLSCQQLGNFTYGIGKRNKVKSMLERACNAKSDQSCIALAKFYRINRESPVTKPKVIYFSQHRVGKN